MKHIGMYIHIPFCQKKCKYCDFNSYDNKQDLIEEYMKYLNKELQEVGEGIVLDKKEGRNNGVCIDTIYIGGGTPSSLDSKYIEEIMNNIRQNYVLQSMPEITIEINPGTVDEKKLQAYINAGINRCSIGVQSSNNEILKSLGRIHTYEDFINTYKLARKVGFKNINVDFIIGLPKQSLEDIQNMIKLIDNIKPEHVSIYSLIVEDGTVLKEEIESGKLELPNENTERQMYWMSKKELEKLGYEHYEISNFAKNGKYSRHNCDCWEQKEYIGFGCGSHSYTDNVRYSNISDINEYINNYKNNKQEDNIIFHEKQDLSSKMQEYIILGLRKTDGVHIDKFEEKFGLELMKAFGTEFEKLKKAELIEISNNKIKLTEKGLDLANIVWEEFV